MSGNRVVVVDVETTGLSVQRGGRVIEVGAVALEDGIVVAEFGTLIDSGAAVSYGAYRVHGISEAMLSGKPDPDAVWRTFYDFVGQSVLVAHNAPFDSSFVRNEMALQGIGLLNDWQCTVRLARKKLPRLPNHRLDTVYGYFFGAIPHGIKRHRALDDARMTALIWEKLRYV